MTSWWRRLFGASGSREEQEEHVTLEPEPRSKRERQRRERDAARGVDEDAEPEEPKRRRVWAITRPTLELICEAAKSSHPNEFGATIRAEEGRVNEVVLVPGTLGGDRHAILPLHMMPSDRTIVGTVHSHPGPSAEPSDADKQLFRNHGHTHIIIHEPYTLDTWVAYDSDGEPIELDVVEF